MPTTIQIEDRTLKILKKVKEETHSSSYDEAINRIVLSRSKNESLAGYLGRKPISYILKGLRDEKDRF